MTSTAWNGVSANVTNHGELKTMQYLDLNGNRRQNYN
jgi:hypothetical protein